jgi:hypothetical protein
MKPVTDAAPWSYSKLKAFETCPKQFFYVKVLASYEEHYGKEARYGNELHEAAELYVRDHEPLPTRFSFLKEPLDKLVSKGNFRLAEYKLGLTKDLEPCGFFSDEVWWRGVVDLLMLDPENEKAWVIDYKSGKDRYPDTGQLELMAMAVFKHFPVVKRVNAALMFVVAESIVKETYVLADEAAMWEKWLNKFNTMDASFINDVWNPNQSGLCRKHCPVLECHHNGRS